MRAHVYRILLLPLCLSLLIVPSDLFAKELIAPTQSLDSARKVQGKLNLSSDPSGLEVTLDGSEIGRTPVWQKAVNPGVHNLQIGDSPTEVSVRPGETKALSLFQGSLIEVPKPSEAVSPAPADPENRLKVPRRRTPAEEQTRGDLTPWERFLNGTSRSF